jgi:outer membrane protein assembly factor BamB
LIAAAAPAGDDGLSLPRPSWWGEVSYSIENAEDWDSALKALEEKYAEPAIEPVWQRGGFLSAGADRKVRQKFDAGAFRWGPVAERDVDAASHRLVLRSPAKIAQFYVLRCKFTLERTERLKIFFSAANFVALYANGQLVWQGKGSGRPRLDERCVAADFAAGRNHVQLIFEARQGAPHLYFRMGRVNSHRRRIGILAALQRAFPEDTERCLRAQLDIASSFEYNLLDLDQAAVEYRRLVAMSAGDPKMRYAGCEGLARVSRAALRPLEELAAGRAMVSVALESLGERERAAALVLAHGALRAGRADTAVAAGALAHAGREESEDVFDAFFRILAAFSLRARCARLLGDASTLAETDSGARKLEAADRILDSLRGEGAFIDVNHTAAVHLESARRLAAAGALDEAAGELLSALDRAGGGLVPSPEGGVGLTGAAAALILSNAELAHAYRRAVDAERERPAAGSVNMLLKRPVSAAARQALLAKAAAAAGEGRYDLAVLAADRCLRSFPDEARAAALLISSLYAAGRHDEAGRCVENLDARLRGKRIAGSLTLGEFVSRFKLPAARAKEIASPPVRSFESIDILWRAPLDPPSHLGGRWPLTRSEYPEPPALAPAFHDGRVYLWNGRSLTARRIKDGEEVFNRTPELPAGLVAGSGEAIPRGALGQLSAVAVGSGTAYVTVNAFDRVSRERRTLVVACDASTGEMLWMKFDRTLDSRLTFVSPPAWAHDRVYVLCRRGDAGGGDVPVSYLACLDGATGRLEFLSVLAASYPALPLADWYGLPRPAPARFAPPPLVRGDVVVAVPNCGVLCRIDGLTGAPISVTAYDRAVISSQSAPLVRLLESRARSAPAVSGGFAVFAPADSAETFILGPDGGLTAAEMPGSREVASLPGTAAILVGGEIAACDLTNGGLLWRTSSPRSDLLDGALEFDGVVCLPTFEGLSVLSADDGRVIAEPRWEDGAARGRLFAAGDRLLAFGADDIVAFRFAAKKTAGVRAVNPGPRRPAPRIPAPPSVRLGLWGMPPLHNGFFLEKEPGCRPLFFKRGSGDMVLLPGRTTVLWDITSAPRQAWSARLPFRPSGALYVGGRLVVYSDWRLEALDAATGDGLWSRETRRLAALELNGAFPLSDVVAAGASMAFIRGGWFHIIDAETGEELYRRNFHDENVARLFAGPDFYALVTSNRYIGTQCLIFDARPSQLRGLSSVDKKHLTNFAVAATEDSVFIAAAGEVLAACIDASSGATRWRNQKAGRLKHCIRALPLDGRFACLGVEKDTTLRAVVFDGTTGRVVGDHRGNSIGAPRGGRVWTLDGKSVLRADPLSGSEKALSVQSGLEPSYAKPLDWLEDDEVLHILLGDPQRKASDGLWLARYNAAAGEKEGIWRLPLWQGGRAISTFRSLGGGRTAVVGDEGILVLPAAAAPPVTVPLYASGRESAGRVSVGKDAAIPASWDAGVVVDGDLSEWKSGDWREVPLHGSDGARIKIGAAWRRDGLVIGVSSDDARAARACGPLRLSFSYLRANGIAWVLTDLFLRDGKEFDTIDGPSRAVVIGRKPNGKGGADLEIFVPWKVLQCKGPPSGEDGIGLGISGPGASGGRFWVFPSDVPYRGEFFARLDLLRPPG